MAYIGNSPGVASQRIVTTFTATSNQTTFTPQSGYTVGYIDVYHNGVRLVNGDDYTASNGTTVVLASGAAADDVVETVAYLPRGLSDGYTKSEADARYMSINEETLPSQTGNSGEFLTTDGTNASWATVDKTTVGLSNVENKSSATIRGEITSGNVTTGLGYTPVNKAGDTMTGRLTIQRSNDDRTIHVETSGGYGAVTFSGGTNTTFFGHSEGSGHFNVNAVAGDACIRGQNGVSIAGSNGVNGIRLDSAGRVTMPYQPSFKAGRSSSYTPGANTNIVFNEASGNSHFNTGGHYSTSTGLFTAPVSGTYFFSALVIYQDMSDGAAADDVFYITKNGSVVTYSFRRAEYVNGTTGNGGYYVDNANIIIKMSANDTAAVKNGRFNYTVHGNTNYTWFAGYLLG